MTCSRPSTHLFGFAQTNPNVTVDGRGQTWAVIAVLPPALDGCLPQQIPNITAGNQRQQTGIGVRRDWALTRRDGREYKCLSLAVNVSAPLARVRSGLQLPSGPHEMYSTLERFGEALKLLQQARHFAVGKEALLSKKGLTL